MSKIRTFRLLTRIHIPEERRRQLSQQYRQPCTCHVHKAALIHIALPACFCWWSTSSGGTCICDSNWCRYITCTAIRHIRAVSCHIRSSMCRQQMHCRIGVGRAARRVTPTFAVRPSHRVRDVLLPDVRPFQNTHFWKCSLVCHRPLTERRTAGWPEVSLHPEGPAIGNSTKVFRGFPRS